MAGLAPLTVVVEAADPSGALITSEFARDMGRTVAAVPGGPRPARPGANRLLEDGALPVTSTADVLDELFGVGTVPLRRPGPGRAADPVEEVLEAVEARVRAEMRRGRGWAAPAAG